MRHIFAVALAALSLAAAPAGAIPSVTSCRVIGDSIGVGLGQALGRCAVDARVGISSAAVIGRARPGFGLTVISAGSNDPTNPRLAANLQAIRARITGRAVWVLPRHPHAAAVVRAVAAEHGDAAIGFAAGRDGIHPASYRALARSVGA